ncbi:MAG TPA: TetR family transcriptional regulator, partial [Anaerolineales bacterium]|nr:TetR family transcriptional regulator [Anaerolineales bacterium]
LTRDVILTAALRIVDEEGLEALSMRRVATAVGVEAMSLYNHVNDKQDLLNGLADLVLAGITPPDPSRRWDRRLEAIAIGLYEALITHPALVVVL